MDPVPTSPQKPLSEYTPQSDPSKYIRTYAKDVAALTNQPIPVAAPAPETPAITSEATADADAKRMGVSLPEFDGSPVNHPGSSVSPKEFDQETVELSKSDSDGIFSKNDDPNVSPLMPQASIGITPAVAPTEDQSERESILARLRAKVAERQKEAEALSKETPVALEAIAPAPSPVLPEPVPEPAALPVPEPVIELQPLPPSEPEPIIPPAPELPLRTAAPTFASEAETVPAIPYVSKPEAPTPAEPLPDLHKEPEGPSPLHTYSSDFADRIDQKDSSTFSVLAAQSDAGQTPARQPARRRSFLPLAAGIGMLVVGVGAVLGAYLYIHQSPSVPMVENVPSLIRFDESVPVQGAGQALMNAISDVAGGAHVSGNVIVTYVTNASSTDPGAGIPQPGSVLIKQLSLPAPDILLRNIEESSTVGVISAGSESRPFFILKVSSYERTFAGMLAWERTMPDDLATFYPAYASMPTSTGTSTATTTLPAFNPTPAGFSDDVVDNYDVRVLRDAYGRSLMLYGYDGKDTLIIARDEAAFSALVSRLSASGT